MQLADTIRSLVRRWYIFLLGILLTVGMASFTYGYVQPTYEAQGSVLLMPAERIVGENGNPYLFLGGMSEVVDVLVRHSDAAESVEPILKQFDGAQYTTEPDRTTSSPIVVVAVKAPTEEMALGTLQAAIKTVTRNLQSMQSELSVAADMRITTKDLVVERVATVNNKMQLQVAIVAVGGGFVATLMLTAFIDGILIQRKARQGVAAGVRRPPGPPASGAEATTARQGSESAADFPAVSRQAERADRLRVSRNQEMPSLSRPKP